MSYLQVIGNSRIPVPTHLYKLVIGFDESKLKPAVGAFVVPNEPIPKEESDLNRFQVSRDELQRMTGFTFLPKLPADETTDLCSSSDNFCRLKNWRDIEIYFARKKVEYATSQQDIDAAMAHLDKKNIKLDTNMRKLIEGRQSQLNKNPTSASRERGRA